MKVINMPRGNGKTTSLVIARSVSGYKIVCCGEAHKRIIKIRAEELKITIPEDLDYNEIFNDQFTGDFGHCTHLGNTMIAENVLHTLENILDLK